MFTPPLSFLLRWGWSPGSCAWCRSSRASSLCYDLGAIVAHAALLAGMLFCCTRSEQHISACPPEVQEKPAVTTLPRFKSCFLRAASWCNSRSFPGQSLKKGVTCVEGLVKPPGTNMEAGWRLWSRPPQVRSALTATPASQPDHQPGVMLLTHSPSAQAGSLQLESEASQSSQDLVSRQGLIIDSDFSLCIILKFHFSFCSFFFFHPPFLSLR